jgi:hypothetical protein
VNIFWEKNHNPSPWKWRESGTPKNKESSVWMDCITAKRNLRRAQRQEEARKRNQLYSDIMENLYYFRDLLFAIYDTK